jgi:hypothetical protein
MTTVRDGLLAPIETNSKWETTRDRGNYDKQGAKKNRLEANELEEEILELSAELADGGAKNILVEHLRGNEATS